jgi:hypothetical protein
MPIEKRQLTEDCPIDPHDSDSVSDGRPWALPRTPVINPIETLS